MGTVAGCGDTGCVSQPDWPAVIVINHYQAPQITDGQSGCDTQPDVPLGHIKKARDDDGSGCLELFHVHVAGRKKNGDVDVIARKLGMMMAVAVLSFFMFTLQEMVLNEYGKMLEEKSKVLVSEEWGTRCCGEQGFSEHTTALKQKERRMVQLAPAPVMLVIIS
ncbi:hypothetical protein Tco_1235825 [Tanacetum coccineum]